MPILRRRIQEVICILRNRNLRCDIAQLLFLRTKEHHIIIMWRLYVEGIMTAVANVTESRVSWCYSMITSYTTSFEAFTVVVFHVEVFRVVTSCNVVVGYKRFGGPCCLRLQGAGTSCTDNFILTLITSFYLVNRCASAIWACALLFYTSFTHSSV
jgi:hypothetical protein